MDCHILKCRGIPASSWRPARSPVREHPSKQESGYMPRLQTTILFATLAITAVPTFAVVNLAATIRDFNNSDSSFNPPSPAGSCRGTGFVQSTLGPNRKPVPTTKFSQTCGPGDSARLANNWFTTAHTYKKSATTCIDIPMTVSVDSTYTYRNPYFFPLDTFNTLPNGRPNPFNVKYQGDDGRQHNFSFCMEMHGTFDYRNRQDFNFIGDDDVWFFINNRLVVDLGGTPPVATRREKS